MQKGLTCGVIGANETARGAWSRELKDPYVDTLIYRVEHDESVSYGGAVALEHDTDDFWVSVSNDEARFKMKRSFSSVKEAQEVVGPFVQAWNLVAGLSGRADDFQLKFDSSTMVDPGPNVCPEEAVHFDIAVGLCVAVTIDRARYPDPPDGILVDADVAVMSHRLNLYRRGQDTLGAMAYFCLTVLEMAASRQLPGKISNRKAVARIYRVEDAVLAEIGRLTAKKGGREARKADGIVMDYSRDERQWLEKVIKILIRRAAEIAYDPSKSRQLITM